MLDTIIQKFGGRTRQGELCGSDDGIAYWASNQESFLSLDKPVVSPGSMTAPMRHARHVIWSYKNPEVVNITLDIEKMPRLVTLERGVCMNKPRTWHDDRELIARVIATMCNQGIADKWELPQDTTWGPCVDLTVLALNMWGSAVDWDKVLPPQQRWGIGAPDAISSFLLGRNKRLGGRSPVFRLDNQCAAEIADRAGHTPLWDIVCQLEDSSRFDRQLFCTTMRDVVQPLVPPVCRESLCQT